MKKKIAVLFMALSLASYGRFEDRYGFEKKVTEKNGVVTTFVTGDDGSSYASISEGASNTDEAFENIVGGEFLGQFEVLSHDINFGIETIVFYSNHEDMSFVITKTKNTLSMYSYEGDSSDNFRNYLNSNQLDDYSSVLTSDMYKAQYNLRNMF